MKMSVSELLASLEVAPGLQVAKRDVSQSPFHEPLQEILVASTGIYCLWP